MTITTDITPDASQLAAIKARELGIRIIAPAGSGKTFTIIQHVIDRIQSDGMDPTRILMLSFDSSAIDSYRTHLSRHLHGRKLPDLMTFADLSARLYRRYIREDVHASRRSSAYFEAIADEQGVIPILEEAPSPISNVTAFDAIKRYGIPVSGPVNAHERDHFPSWFTQNILGLPSDYFTNREVELAEFIEELIGRYRANQESLINQETGRVEYEAIDIELALSSVLRGRTHDAQAIRREIQGRQDLIVVDEAQDISRLDAILLERILHPEASLVLAGDDDQTIHEASFADSRFLRQANRLFHQSKRRFHDYHLEVTYRTPGNILNHAQYLINNNDTRRQKTVRSSRPDAGMIRAHAITSSDERLPCMLTIMREVHANSQFSIDWSDIAILVPDEARAQSVRQFLQREKVPSSPVRTLKGYSTGAKDEVNVLLFREAKGRGWKVVTIPWCSDDDIPSEDARLMGDIEAERRLFYVTMTRSSEQLHMVYIRKDPLDEVRRSTSGDITGTTGASRFLFEAMVVVDHGRSLEAQLTSGAVPAKVRDYLLKCRRFEACGDYENANTNGFKIVEWGIRRLLNTRSGDTANQIKLLAIKNQAFARFWFKALESWRKARNPASHYDDYDAQVAQSHAARDMSARLPAFIEFVVDPKQENPGTSGSTVTRDILTYRVASDSDTGTEPIQPLSEPSESVRIDSPQAHSTRTSRVTMGRSPLPEKNVVSPKPPSSFRGPGGLLPVRTADAMRIAYSVAGGFVDPKTKQPVLSAPIPRRNEGIEYLPLQLALILYDARFQFPGEFLYSQSPIFARFCVERGSGVIPQNLELLATNNVPEHLAQYESRIFDLMDDVLSAYISTVHPRNMKALLSLLVSDALLLRNGEAKGGFLFYIPR